jgi:hypothetical protein
MSANFKKVSLMHIKKIQHQPIIKWIGTIQQNIMRVVSATLLVLLVDKGAAFFVTTRHTFGHGETKICMAAGADVERVVKTSTSAVDPL